jgi:ADP-dependent NAD(P)H-hydrate dehydratase / NAD(P)H-hydrate epimerase
MPDIFPERDEQSHKGENGKVAVIGGSRVIHGAPIFSALAAEASGVDLVYMFVSPANESITKNASLNVQVRTFRDEEIGNNDVQPILELLATIDCAVIGPGLNRDKNSLAAIGKIVAGALCPVVLDASALQNDTLKWVRGKTAILTPHLGELGRLEFPANALANTAQANGITILLKGPMDIIADQEGHLHESPGGNAGMTVGGTGDALAGLIAGLVAQKMPPVDAALLASKTMKKVGELLAKEKGYHFTTQDVIEQIPYILNNK